MAQDSLEEPDSTLDEPVAAAPPGSPRRTRTTFAIILFLIGGLLAPVGLVGIWAARTIDDTDRYVATVSPLLASEIVRDTVSDLIVEGHLQHVEVEELLAEALPENAQQLSGPLVGGLRTFVGSQVDELLATPQAQAAWEQINRELQNRITSALKGESTGAIQVQDDAIVLDTGDLFLRIQSELVARGFTIFERVPLPAQADRQIVLVESVQIQTVSTIYRVVQPLANGLIWVALAILAIAVFVLPNRRRGLITVGSILIASGLLVLGLLWLSRGAMLAQLSVSDTSWQAVIFDTVTRFLDGLTRAAITLGIVGVVLGVVYGPAGWATELRRGGGVALSRAAARGVEVWPALADVGRSIRPLRVGLGLVIIGLAIARIVASAPLRPSTIIWTTVMALLAWLVVLFLSAAGEETATEKVRGDEAESSSPNVGIGAGTVG